MFGGCSSFLNKALEKVYRKQLGNYNPGNNTVFILKY